jgi:hypothetical protein
MTGHSCRNPDCGKPLARIKGRLEGCSNLCWGCYHRWDRNGRPDVVPPPMTHAERTALAAEAKALARRERAEDFRLLTRFRSMTCAEAAAVLGVTAETGWAYDRLLRRLEAA